MVVDLDNTYETMIMKMTMMMMMMMMMIKMMIIAVTQSVVKLGPPDLAWK